MAEEHELDDVAIRALMANNELRMRERLLESGRDGGLHGHDLDWLLVQVAGDKIAGLFD
jgi:hypothetical protein